jgi:transcriptional regulator with XRE-family HTH domain
MPVLDYKAIVQRLKTMRLSKNLSVRKFAIQAGVDPSQYTKIENGQLPLTEKMIDKLLQAHDADSRDNIVFGLPKKEGFKHSGKLMPRHIRDSLAVADGLMRMMPPLKPGLSPEQLIDVCKEREKKYEMAYALTRKILNELVQIYQKAT